PRPSSWPPLSWTTPTTVPFRTLAVPETLTGLVMVESASGLSMMMCPLFAIGVGDAEVVGSEDPEAAADALVEALADADALAEALENWNTVCWLSFAHETSSRASVASTNSPSSLLFIAKVYVAWSVAQGNDNRED